MKKIKKISVLILSVLMMLVFVLPVSAAERSVLSDASEEDIPDNVQQLLTDEDIEAYLEWMKEGIDTDGGIERIYPAWWPEDADSFEDYHNENAPRIVDNADIFTDSEEARLTALIQESIEKTGADLVIYTDRTNYGLGNQMCAADFYQFSGYGLGDDYNGSVLFINMDPGQREYYTAARGACRKYITEETLNDLQDWPYDDMKAGRYYAAMEKYIHALTGLFTKGKVPETADAFRFRLIVCLIIGVVAGLITMGVLVSQMKKVKVATKAGQYLVRDSVHMRAANDFFLYATVTRTKIDNDSKGGGGGSSFSGGFSSHGGGSFSGGGRSF